MTDRAALICPNDLEESEATIICDIMRRGGVACDLVALGNDRMVTGAHGIRFMADEVFRGNLDGYTMVILPGGYGACDAMCASEGLAQAMRELHERGGWITAMCAAPVALDVAGLLAGRTYTCYPEVKGRVMTESATWVDALTVRDGHVVTGQGPACAYAFAYRLLECLGKDAEAVRSRMVYTHAFAEGDE